MKLINGSRGSGKTEAIIRYAYENCCLILCVSKAHIDIIKRKAIELDLDIIEPMRFKDYFSSDLQIWSKIGFERGQFEIVVDELEFCLKDFFEEEISVATGTIPTIHPQTFSISQRFNNCKCYMSDKEYKENVLGEWNL